MHCVLVLVAREPVPVAVDELVELPLQLEEHHLVGQHLEQQLVGQQLEEQQLVEQENLGHYQHLECQP